MGFRHGRFFLMGFFPLFLFFGIAKKRGGKNEGLGDYCEGIFIGDLELALSLLSRWNSHLSRWRTFSSWLVSFSIVRGRSCYRSRQDLP